MVWFFIFESFSESSQVFQILIFLDYFFFRKESAIAKELSDDTISRIISKRSDSSMRFYSFISLKRSKNTQWVMTEAFICTKTESIVNKLHWAWVFLVIKLFWFFEFSLCFLRRFNWKPVITDNFCRFSDSKFSI